MLWVRIGRLHCIMAFRVEWTDDEERIILLTYFDTMMMSDYIESIDRCREIMMDRDHTIHVIVDRSGVTDHPPRITKALRHAATNIPGNVGLRVVIKPTTFTRIMVDMARTIVPLAIENLKYADSITEAHALIKKWEDEKNTSPS